VERFVHDLRGEDVDLTVAGSPREVVAASDVLCTLTPSLHPIVRGEWLRAGMHVNVVGAPPRPSHREIDTEAVARCRVVVDDAAVARQESGAIAVALAAGAVTPEHCRTELGEVIAGLSAGRRSPAEITMYTSVGVGIQDVVVARLVVDIARTKSLGTDVDLAR
jgi:ornithine cyclodeaminase/alanine dehydrogenase